MLQCQSFGHLARHYQRLYIQFQACFPVTLVQRTQWYRPTRHRSSSKTFRCGLQRSDVCTHFFDTTILPLEGAAQSYSISALLIRRRRFSRSPSILCAISSCAISPQSILRVYTSCPHTINAKRTSSVSVYRPFLSPSCFSFRRSTTTFSTAVVELHFHRRVRVRRCRFLRLLVSMILHKTMPNTIDLFLYCRRLECVIFFTRFIMPLYLSLSLSFSPSLSRTSTRVQLPWCECL